MGANTDYKNKDLVVFDLDGTLTETKSNLPPDMSEVLKGLLQKKLVAVIGGGGYPQFQKQFLSHLDVPTSLLSRLFLFPTTATVFYRYQKRWQKVYAYNLSSKEKKDIRKAFGEVLKEINYIPPEKTYGKIIEDRGTQMSYSFLGQDVVAILGEPGIKMKKDWVRKNTPLKMKIAKLVQKKIPQFEVRAAGYTTIDVTRRGIDKAYGINQIKLHLKIPIRKMVFIGDAIFPGGNDYAVKKTGVEAIQVSGPKEVKRVIKQLLKRTTA